MTVLGADEVLDGAHPLGPRLGDSSEAFRLAKLQEMAATVATLPAGEALGPRRYYQLALLRHLNRNPRGPEAVALPGPFRQLHTYARLSHYIEQGEYDWVVYELQVPPYTGAAQERPLLDWLDEHLETHKDELDERTLRDGYVHFIGRFVASALALDKLTSRPPKAVLSDIQRRTMAGRRRKAVIPKVPGGALFESSVQMVAPSVSRDFVKDKLDAVYAAAVKYVVDR